MSTSAGGLLERDRELQIFRELIDETAAGRGGVIVFEGDPGVGKSALIKELGAAAAAAGLRPLSAIAGALEREYPFGVVRQLFELELVGADGERRERLLAGAAALAAPIVGAAAGEVAELGQDASFATLHGLYWLTAALAEERPLLLSIDDAHWADPSSLRFVDFLARRIGELPVLVAVAARPHEPGAEIELLDSIAEADAATVVRPGSLSTEAAATLIEAQLGERAEAGVADAAHLATGGNPLLLTQLLRTLDAGEKTVTAARVKEAVPSSVSRSVGRRIGRLPEPTREAAEALATLGERDGPRLLEAVTELGPEAVAVAMRELREVGLVEPDSGRFVHPLIRQAVAQGVPPQRRDALHAAAARALRSREGREEEVIVHLLAGPPLNEGWAAEVLAAGARRALAEGAPEAAVTRLERAVEEDPEHVTADLQLALGRAKLAAGDPEARIHLGLAVEAEDPVIAAEALIAQLFTESLSTVPPSEGVATRVREAVRRLGDDAPKPLLSALLGSISVASSIGPSLVTARAELFEDPRFTDLPVVTSWRSYEGAAGEMPVAEVLRLAHATLENGPLSELAPLENPQSWWPFGAFGMVEAPEEWARELSVAEQGAAAHGSRIGRLFVFTVRAQMELWYGSAAVGEAESEEAARWWGEMGLPTMDETSASQLVMARVLRNKIAEAEATEPRMGDPDGLFPRGQMLIARSQLRLAQGRTADAVADLRELQEVGAALRLRHFGLGYTRVQLAESLIADGQAEEGLEIARGEVEVSRRAWRPGQEAAALVTVAAAAATMGETEEEIGALEAAVAVEGVRSPIPRSRALIELGAALRRRGLRKEARERLREGQEVAGRAGLRALEQRALEELVVAGARPRSPYSSGVESLTPSELRVAKQAASGLTNREIAEALFVTRKTVELHLGNAYGKLGIRSRAQLPEALDRGGSAEP